MRIIAFAAAACLSALALQAGAHEPHENAAAPSTERRTCRIIDDGVERTCTPAEERQARATAERARRTVEEMRPQIERSTAIARASPLQSPDAGTRVAVG